MRLSSPSFSVSTGGFSNFKALPIDETECSGAVLSCWMLPHTSFAVSQPGRYLFMLGEMETQWLSEASLRK